MQYHYLQLTLELAIGGTGTLAGTRLHLRASGGERVALTNHIPSRTGRTFW